MPIPNAEFAVVDLRKLTEYCLSTTHAVGKHKAKVFRSALGITSADAAILRQWLLEAVVIEGASLDRIDEFGERYELDFSVTTASGDGTIRAGWIIRAGEDFPRLTTCFVRTL